MMYVRKANTRGHANFGWLDSFHSFSFGNYYDPEHMGISSLRVINDDTVAGGAGFGTHGHRDMEIISYVLEGAIEHQDSMGNRFVVPAGEVQRMSAGSGVMHSEYNASQTDPLRFLQIWIHPNERGIKPSYEQAEIAQSARLTPLVTPDGRDGSLSMHQNAAMYRLVLKKGDIYTLPASRGATYLHVIEGKAAIEGGTDTGEQIIGAGDGVGFDSMSATADVTAQSDSFKALWFDLPPMEPSQ